MSNRSKIPSSAKVVVIGGGVIGCSVAYHLTKFGWKDVVLLERDQLTSGTTWHAAGLVSQLGPTAAVTKIRKYTLDLYKKLEKEVLLKFQAKQTISKVFTIPLRKGDPLQGEIKVGNDILPVDSKRYFSHHPNQNIKVLVVDGDPGSVSHQSESFYLERALNPFSVSVSHIDPTISTLAELPLRKLSDFSVVILANVREFPIDYELELEDFVLRGGALIFGMGDQIDAKYYNENLGNLLPVTLEAVEEYKKVYMLLQNNKHPVMQAFSPQSIEEMKDIPFKAIYTIQARNKKKFNVANWFTNKNPAVIETGMGKGKIVVFLSSLDRAWNDFPIQPTFLPWIQRWTQYAARGLENISYQNLLVGETYQQNNDEGRWVVQTPGGNLYQATTQDGKTTLTETLDPGIYSVFKIQYFQTIRARVRFSIVFSSKQSILP